jgi:metal-responsive CopG/Arc/MetJ family transcriptional regulator
MAILSISIDGETLRRLNAIQHVLGFKSRSKLLRNAVLGVLNEYETLESLRGNVQSVFVLTYKKNEKGHVFELLHKFEDSIRTELHQHSGGTCIDVLGVNASAEGTRKLFGALKKCKCVFAVNCTVVSRAK